MFNKNAYTLLEIIVTITIIGVLSAAILPNFSNAVERSRTSEAVKVLHAIYDGQRTFEFETGAYASSIGSLEVGINVANIKAYNAPQVVPGTDDILGRIERSDGSYWLHIETDGDVFCSADGAGAPLPYCTKLGYN